MSKFQMLDSGESVFILIIVQLITLNFKLDKVKFQDLVPGKDVSIGTTTFVRIDRKENDSILMNKKTPFSCLT
jgi:hypothetical protein